jgi:isopentenyl-diphosphate delta-isomerase
MTSTREDHLVELVDSSGTAIGTTTVSEAHTAPGQLHRAFSVFVRDSTGRVLLQQRAAVKTRFPLRWANTCCGHPAPGEDLAVAAGRRLAEEVGITGVSLTAVGVYAYYAEDPDTGRVEYEYDHVLVGELPAGAVAQPDPDEVADLRWVTVPGLLAEMGADARAYAPWLPGVAAQLAASSLASADLSSADLSSADERQGRPGDG